MLNKHEFDLLYTIHKEGSKTQRELATVTNLALGTVNKTLNTLKAQELINDFNQITSTGVKALEPYRVKNAVIMAAGFSSRFVPLSYELPKGLLKVKGEVLIERQIKQLHAAGINDIIVVVGYLKEKFAYLEEKFNVKLRTNQEYATKNNHSTLYLVREQLDNTYICSSDNYFNENVFDTHVYDAYYSAVYAKGNTSEYCIKTGAHDLIVDVTIGGKDSWVMLGHVYFSKSFSQKFVSILEKEYNKPGNDHKLWENIYMEHIKELPLFIRKYPDEVIFEFDSLDELRQFDDKYVNHTESKIMKNICQVLNCEEKEIKEIKPIKKGLTNVSFYFKVRDNEYVYRHPGAGTEAIINRKGEAKALAIAKELGLDNTFIYMNAEEGWKISEFIPDTRNFDYHNWDDVKKGLTLVRKLHEAKVDVDFAFSIWDETLKLEKLTKENNGTRFDDFEELKALIEKVYQHTESDGIKKVLCHNDCYDPNFLTDGNLYYLIDWEYAGKGDPASDLGTFICCSDYTSEEVDRVLSIYFNHTPTLEEKRHYIGYVAISSFYWFVWACYKESVGNIIGDYLFLWHKYAKYYGKLALELYNS